MSTTNAGLVNPANAQEGPDDLSTRVPACPDTPAAFGAELAEMRRVLLAAAAERGWRLP